MSRVVLRLESGEVLAEGLWRDAIRAESEAMGASRGRIRHVLADGTTVDRGPGYVFITRPGVRIEGIT